MATYLGFIDCAAAAVMLHMDTSDCEYNETTANVTAQYCGKYFNNNVYTSGIVPIFDLLYFTKKLNFHVNKRLHRTLPQQEKVLTRIRMEYYNKPLNDLFGANNPNYEWVTILPTEGNNTLANQSIVKSILDSQFEKNRAYLDENFTYIAKMDGLTVQILCFLDAFEQKNGRRNDHAFEFDKARKVVDKSDPPILTNPRFVKECYEKEGLIVPNRQALKNNWNFYRDEATKTLYDDMIKNRKLEQYCSEYEFELCLISAVKDTAYHMQNGINYQPYINPNERR